MRKLKSILAFGIFAGTILACNSVFAAANYNYSPQSNSNTQTLQGQVVYVPSGMVAPAILSNALNSETATVGTSISATLPSNLTYNKIVIAPAGSVLNGTIVKAKKAGMANRNGQIQVIFNNIRTPQGYNIAVNAVFKTEDNTGVLKGGTKMDGGKDYLKNSAIGAGGGALFGTAIGAITGSVGEGAIFGTAIGAGAGAIKATTNRGEDVNIPANAKLDIFFLQPITVSAPATYGY